MTLVKPGERTRLPVTLLSGFLGAGKTTLLNALLSSDHGYRMAVLVNDMSDVNIDEDLVRQRTGSPSDDYLVEMHNGCICCTLREDLQVEVRRLAESGRFDWLLVESTGISEPMHVAAAFDHPMADGTPLGDFAYVDTLVTVVDGLDFMPKYLAAEPLSESGAERDDEDDRTISDLLIEQVEFANVLLVSKQDRVASVDLEMLTSVLRALNPSARIVPMTKGQVPKELVLGTSAFSMETARTAPGWLAALRGGQVSESESLKIGSAVWHARRPLHTQRFWDFIHSKWSYGILLRSKGFFWLATRPQCIGLWQQAGGVLRYEYAGQWWRFAPREHWPTDPQAVQWIEQKWTDDVGDCRQEIVFIGQSLDTARLFDDLDRCLVTDVEWEGECSKSGDGANDPFPSWAELTP